MPKVIAIYDSRHQKISLPTRWSNPGKIFYDAVKELKKETKITQGNMRREETLASTKTAWCLDNHCGKTGTICKKGSCKDAAINNTDPLFKSVYSLQHKPEVAKAEIILAIKEHHEKKMLNINARTTYSRHSI